MSWRMQQAFVAAAIARLQASPDAHTALLFVRPQHGNEVMRNWPGKPVVLVQMAAALLSEAVTEATQARELALANRIDAALERLGDPAVIRSRHVIREEDL